MAADLRVCMYEMGAWERVVCVLCKCVYVCVRMHSPQLSSMDVSMGSRAANLQCAMCRVCLCSYVPTGAVVPNTWSVSGRCMQEVRLSFEIQT